MTTQMQSVSNTSSTASTHDNSTLMRRVLVVNGISGFLSAALLILASRGVADFLGISDQTILGAFDGATLMTLIGIGFIGFGALCMFAGTRTPFSAPLGWLVTGLDFSWVILSAVLLLTNALNLTTGGSWAVLIVADVVLTIAILEVIGMRRILRG